ncbi:MULTISPECIES: ABC transporter ATP-binding protein [unclassified Streptomyces]|uniref:ABC transporter ATP-binding protein n=1 Tax=unclassified Streptomyces TaxID=2593676 RepID=UPI0003780B37|nr:MULTISPECIES: ABC transporter ATP-binding protein [unclassified Streptomyces]MYT30835.1 ATP-binding cassette domain-containing protein [Streptomyces sp. SID8354]
MTKAHSFPAIQVSGLAKSFGRTRALDGLDLRVEAGEVHGFLGPNGAGKSTTLRVLLGLLRADRGTAQVLGRDPWQDAVEIHRRVAYVPGDVTLWRNLSGGEVIDLYGRLHQGSGAKRLPWTGGGGRHQGSGAKRLPWTGGGGRRAGGLDADRRSELLERFELDPTKKGRTYSKGNRQKVALVAAFASDVDLLILDEPTSGLDPLMEEVFQSCVAEERDRGRTVLLSSHVLSEVEALCDRVSIIRKGRTVESGSLGELRHLTRTTVVAELAGPPTGLDGLAGVHGLAVQPLRGGGCRVRLQADTDRLGAVLGPLGAAGLRSLTSTPPTLEELFLRHYQDDLRPDARQRDGARAGGTVSR